MQRIPHLGKQITSPTKLKAVMNNCKSWRMLSSQPQTDYNFKTLLVNKVSDFVFHVQINRPEKQNAMNEEFLREVVVCFKGLHRDSDCRAIVLSGNSKIFTAGIDLASLASMASVATSDADIARKCRTIKELIVNFQNTMSSLENCSKPVIAAVHGPCIGAGVDFVTAADIRYCTTDAWFQVKEVDVGLAADVGTLQRLPKIIGSESLVRELCLTSRQMFADEALKAGLVSRTFSDNASLMKGSLDLAASIAEKSPVAVQATKAALVHARDHSVQEGLDYIATMNMALLQSEDVMTAAMSQIKKEKPTFSKL